MRIWLVSDWHLEVNEISVSQALGTQLPGADVCVVPGDLHTGDVAVRILIDRICDHMPVIYVPGNHCYFGRLMNTTRAEMRAAAEEHPRMHLLDPGVVVVEGTRFIGATLWCDYDLHGTEQRAQVMERAKRSIKDHSRIGIEESQDKPAVFWMPEHARARHLEERALIEAELKKPFDGPTVVVTHHAPHPGSIAARFRNEKRHLETPFFVNDLEDLILEHHPDAWLHGHIHDSADYLIGSTRILANPRGYEKHNGPENRTYDPLLTVEIPTLRPMRGLERTPVGKDVGDAQVPLVRS